MPSTFNALNAQAYDQFMGRWSRDLAPLFIAFAGLRDGERVLDVGCGTGSLAFALPQAAEIGAVDAIDFAEVYVEHARALNSDPRIGFRQGDACALPFGDGVFDRALSLLALHVIPAAEQALAEMVRVVRPGGVVAAAVWDNYGGVANQRMFWDTAAALDPAAARPRDEFYGRPLTRQGEMRDAWRRAGLVDIADASLTIRMSYIGFDDYWAPLAAGEGPMGKYVTGLAAADRRRFEQALRSAYEGGRGDGPRSFAAFAWACRGVVPG